MKKQICLQFGILLLLAGLCLSCNRNKAPVESQQNKIVFFSSPDLYDLTSEWAAVFCKLNPEMEIEVIQSSEAAIAKNLESTTQLSFVTSEFEPEIYNRSLWKLTIGRDIIVPVVNAKNPNIQEICDQGISPAGLARILNSPGYTTWSSLIEGGPDVPVNFYMTDDLSLQTELAGFLETDPLSQDKNTVLEPDELVACLQEDPFALGICHLLDVIDRGNHHLVENINILPLDRNGNGYIDYKEDVYTSVNAFTRGVWIGKYPKKLARNIYSVASLPPSHESELAFLNWVFTRGHVLLDNHGFGNLPESERMAHVSILDGLRDGQPAPGYVLPKEPGFITGPLPYILAFLLLMSLLLYFGIRIRNRRQEGLTVQESILPGLAFDGDQVEVTPGLYYDNSHTWAYLEKDGGVRVGINDFLQRVTGPLTRVKMKSPGDRVKKGKKAVSIIQDGKQLDICAPVSGTIKEFNRQLLEDSSLLNSSPYTEGWIYKIEPANWVQEVQFLIMGDSCRAWLKKEIQRLKEFLSESMRSENVGFVHVLQDGGEIREHILKDLGPELWEDFQTNFLDVPS